MLSTQNPEPLFDPKVRRQIIHLVWLAAAIFVMLPGSMLASFSVLLPSWVSATSCAATGLVAWVVIGRAESLRKRSGTTRRTEPLS